MSETLTETLSKIIVKIIVKNHCHNLYNLLCENDHNKRNNHHHHKNHKHDTAHQNYNPHNHHDHYQHLDQFLFIYFIDHPKTLKKLCLVLQNVMFYANVVHSCKPNIYVHLKRKKIPKLKKIY